jgi:hypothetical protein
MGVLYLPYFDVTEVADYNGTLGTLTLADGSNPNVVIDVAGLEDFDQEFVGDSSIFCHRSGINGYIIRATSSQSSAVAFPHYAHSPLGRTLRNAIAAEATVQGWTLPNTFAVSFSDSTARYTVTHGSVAFSLTWSNAVTRNLFGFAGNSASATSHVGTKTPLYCINSTYLDVMNESDFYEPDGIANFVQADDGSGSGIARSAGPKYKDWSQDYETKLKTHRVLGAQPDGTDDPFTHEHLFEHCRGKWPFMLYGVDRRGSYNVAEIYHLRTDGTSFKPERMTPGNDSQFKIPYKCVLAGVMDGVFT